MTENEKKNTGCAFGKVTREKVLSLEKSFDDFRKNEFHTLQITVEKIRDELLSRIPWPMTIFMAAMSSLCVGLIIFALMR